MTAVYGDFGVPDADLRRIVNRVSDGFIRTEADELQYNLHVLLRFDLERALMSGDLQVDGLEAAWNDRFEADFGYPVDRPSNGVLQDVHWSVGLLGYSTHFKQRSGTCLHEPQATRSRRSSQGGMSAATGWLRENVQKHGGLYEPRGGNLRACGQPPTEAPLLTYSKTKFIESANLGI